MRDYPQKWLAHEIERLKSNFESRGIKQIEALKNFEQQYNPRHIFQLPRQKRFAKERAI